jgi:transcription elongation factor GreA
MSKLTMSPPVGKTSVLYHSLLFTTKLKQHIMLSKFYLLTESIVALSLFYYLLKRGNHMVQKKIHVTKQGLDKLESELKQLITVQRPEVAGKIKRAREVGGTENNAEYDDAKNEQAFVEGRILMLENIIKNATIIESPAIPGVVELGDKVLIRNQDGKIEQFTIVGSTEANPVEGKISNESPVGRALLGKKAGDKVLVQTPAGLIKLLVMEVS